MKNKEDGPPEGALRCVEMPDDEIGYWTPIRYQSLKKIKIL
jgi:hypothetical protein